MKREINHPALAMRHDPGALKRLLEEHRELNASPNRRGTRLRWVFTTEDEASLKGLAAGFNHYRTRRN